MTSSPKTTALYLRPLARLAGERGIDFGALLAEQGLGPEVLSRAAERIDVRVTSALLERARGMLDDPAIGISLVRYTEYAVFGPLGVALAAGGSLRAVLQRITRFHAVVSDAGESRVFERAGSLVIEFTGRTDPPPHPQSILFSMASLASFVRLRIGRSVNPSGVCLRDVDDDCRSAASRYFRCEVARGDAFEVEYPASTAASQLDGSDPEMAAMLEQTLARRVPEASRSLGLELGLFLESRFPEGEPTLAEAAKAMRMSERSLQRRLRDEGRTFQSVLDDTRRSLVERHLHGSNLSLTELAFLLGFTDASSFSRAFRRWYGVPASALRKKGSGNKP